MKIVVLYVYTLCLTVINFSYTNGDEFSPLTLSIAIKNYKLDTYAIIKNKIMDLKTDKPEDSRAILCCPITSKDNIENSENSPEKIFSIRKIIRKKSDFDTKFFCENQYIPTVTETSISVFPRVQDLNLKAYEIRYKVCKVNKDLLYENVPTIPALKNDSCDTFSQLRILFNEKTLSTEQIRYDLIVGEQFKNTITCKDFNSEKLPSHEIKMSEHVKNVYSKSNQENIFKNAVFSLKRTTSDSDKDVQPILRQKEGSNEEDYLVPEPLVPVQDFSDENLALATCTRYNTVPMWKNVTQGDWKKLKDYIRKVASIISPVGKFNVITGTYGIFKYRTSENYSKEKKLYLAQQETPVPEIIWTLVMYVIPAFGVYPATNYGIIFVTENRRKPYMNADRYVCDIIDCEHYLWGGIRESVENSLTYCCKFSKENLKKFGIEIAGLTPPYCVLNLKTFSWGRESDGGTISKNVAQMIDDKEKTINSEVTPIMSN